MKEQIFYEDITEGMEIPTLVKHPTTTQLVKWAGASGDYAQIHYDKDFALAQGLPGVIVHGWCTLSFLCQALTDWIGIEGALKKINCSYRGMLYPGEDMLCKGTVVKKYTNDGERLVECEVWAENPKGEKAVPASAVVLLPSRS